MGDGFNNDIVGGTKLVIPAINSPGYTPGVTGWTINRDGSAEFNNLTIRGTFNGTDFVINSAGAFFYSGTPAAGNLVVAIATSAGSDAFGNGYGIGITLLDTLNPSADRTLSLLDTDILWQATQYLFGPQISSLLASGNADSPGLQLSGGSNGTVSLTNPTGQITLFGASADGTGPAWNQIGAADDNTGTLQSCITQIIGQVVATNPTVTAATTNQGAAGLETWHTPSYGTGWAGGPGSGTRQPLHYRVDALDNLVMTGAMHTTSATPGVPAFTLPVGWRPAVLQLGYCVENNAGAFILHELEVNINGGVTINPNLTVTAHDVYINCTVPLGNIS